MSDTGVHTTRGSYSTAATRGPFDPRRHRRARLGLCTEASPGAMHGVTFANVLIGVDGRDGGRDAIALARRLAAPNARLTLAHVDSGGVASWWGHELREERVFDREVSMLARERDRAGIDAGIICVRDASAAAGLQNLAKTSAADLIVIGSPRHALLGRVLLGHDVRAGLAGAPCAIAIAPRHGAPTSRTDPAEPPRASAD